MYVKTYRYLIPKKSFSKYREGRGEIKNGYSKYGAHQVLGLQREVGEFLSILIINYSNSKDEFKAMTDQVDLDEDLVASYNKLRGMVKDGLIHEEEFEVFSSSGFNIASLD